MANQIQLKYDELDAIMKKMRIESDDVSLLLSRTRQMVQNIQQEWIGRGSKEFTRDMDQKLLPGLKRLAEALDISQETLRKIIRVIKEADEGNARLFKLGLNLVQGAHLSAGAGIGGVVGAGLSPGGAGVQFSQRPGSVAGSVIGAGMGSDESADGGAGGSETGGAVGSAAGGSTQGAPLGSSGAGADQVSGKEVGGVGSGGGGGGSGGSTGVGKGDLGGLSSGSGTSAGSAASGAGVSGKGATGMPDHIYEPTPMVMGVGGNPGGPPLPTPDLGITGQPNGESEAGAAAVVGVSGAAAGGAAKIVRGKKK